MDFAKLPSVPHGLVHARLPRRTLLGAGLGLAVGTACAQPHDGSIGGVDRSQWDAFVARYVAADGRVVDTGNKRISHTEGQGWGLLFAEYFGDRPVFERIAAWTAAHLRRPSDRLHKWRYVPGAADPTPDANNATDGDLFIAWAMARAARRWVEPAHAETAAGIAKDILRLLTREAEGGLLLLPGVAGFETKESFTLNPSYYVFPAFAALNSVVPSPAWRRLRRDGLALIERSRFGKWALPPDWLDVARPGGEVAPAPNWPARCSFDAIRVPLYMVWAGHGGSPVVRGYAAFFSPRDGIPPPAWTDLISGTDAPYPAPPGMLAAGEIANAAASGAAASGAAPQLPLVENAPDYYSAALTLLSEIAWRSRKSVLKGKPPTTNL